MKKILIGNAAIARGAYEYGVRVATAYPGTPSTEITEEIAKFDEIDAQWSTNEKVALEVGIGASIAGARTLVSMKHVGLNVAADPFMSVSYPGVNAGLVIAVADDPGQHSSQNEQDTRYFGMAAKVPIVEPSNSQECKDFVGAALEISEEFDTPVILRLTTRVSHSQGFVEIEDRRDIPLRDYDQNPNKYIVAPAVAKRRRVIVEDRLRKLEEFAETTPLNTVEYKDLKIGVITSGVAYEYSKEVLPDASFLKLGLSYPLPKEKIEEFIDKCDQVYVIEELEPIFEEKIRSWGLDVIGKEVIPTIGELSPSIIREAILGESIETLETDFTGEIPARPPTLCPGCHHRGVFYVLKKLKLHVSGDIGCYTLAAFEPLAAMDTSICMGASIGMALGFEKARGKDFAKKSLAVIGDSTFLHSGITGLIDVVYNGGSTTTIILDNSITGMTGHQENPSTGFDLQGDPAPRVDFEAIARAVGVKRVRVVDAYDLVELEEIIEEEINADEPSVIITKRPCILIKRYDLAKEPLRIDLEKCTNCKICLRIGCPAISSKGDKMEINPILCVGCGLCTELCNFDAIVGGGE